MMRICFQSIKRAREIAVSTETPRQPSPVEELCVRESGDRLKKFNVLYIPFLTPGKVKPTSLMFLHVYRCPNGN